MLGRVDSNRRFGGLGLFWNNDIDLHILSSSSHYIDVEIGGVGDREHWHFTGFYGLPNTLDRSQSWSMLHHLAATSTIPWVCASDFNEILASIEKK